MVLKKPSASVDLRGCRIMEAELLAWAEGGGHALGARMGSDLVVQEILNNRPSGPLRSFVLELSNSVLINSSSLHL